MVVGKPMVVKKTEIQIQVLVAPLTALHIQSPSSYVIVQTQHSLGDCMDENVDRDQLPAILDEGVRSIGIDPEDLPDGNYPGALEDDDEDDE